MDNDVSNEKVNEFLEKFNNYESKNFCIYEFMNQSANDIFK